jgi:hypothetical protein
MSKKDKNGPTADELALANQIRLRIAASMEVGKSSRGQAEKEAIRWLAAHHNASGSLLVAWKQAKCSEEGLRLLQDYVDSGKLPGVEARSADSPRRSSRRKDKADRRGRSDAFTASGRARDKEVAKEPIKLDGKNVVIRAKFLIDLIGDIGTEVDEYFDGEAPRRIAIPLDWATDVSIRIRELLSEANT